MILTIVLSLLLVATVTDAGVSYVRWGRTTCPAGNFALYKGFMAGPYYGVGGSGANFLCMGEKPQFVNSIPGRQGAGGVLHGVELDNTEVFKGLFSSENIPGGVLTSQDMPCVRCYVEGSSDLMMFPGRQDCGPSGYDLQYKGFLVSEWHGPRGRSEFACMDTAPEGLQGGQADNNQGIVYPVEVSCGSLPCNPYVDGLEVTCAVCTY